MLEKNKLNILQPMKYWWLYFAISLTVIIPGVYSLIINGLKLSIDFTGGSTIQVSSSSYTSSKFFSIAKATPIDLKDVRQNGDTWTLTTAPIDRNQYANFISEAKKQGDLKELAFDTIGPSLGAELVQKTGYGIVIAATLILLYVAYRFKNLKFGIFAILAMLHDLLVVVGVFSLLGKYFGVEIDTLFVTALLTILSFSVHDTIVVYDRIRELKKHHAYLEFEEIVNRAVVETMGRSLNNSMTIIFMLLAMYLLGGTTTEWFIFALLVGTVSGTYSSTFTAAPLLIVWDKISRKYIK